MDAKHPRHEEALTVVKASRARLMNEAEVRKKEVTIGTFTTKKMKTFPDEAIALRLEAETACALKVELWPSSTDRISACSAKNGYQRV